MYGKSRALAFGFGMQGEACLFLRVLVYCLFRRRRGFHGDGGGGRGAEVVVEKNRGRETENGSNTANMKGRGKGCDIFLCRIPFESSNNVFPHEYRVAIV